MSVDNIPHATRGWASGAWRGALPASSLCPSSWKSDYADTSVAMRVGRQREREAFLSRQPCVMLARSSATYSLTINGWSTFPRICFSDIICSTCFRRMISFFLRIFSAKYLSCFVCRHRRTRPNVPVPNVSRSSNSLRSGYSELSSLLRVDVPSLPLIVIFEKSREGGASLAAIVAFCSPSLVFACPKLLCHLFSSLLLFLKQNIITKAFVRIKVVTTPVKPNLRCHLFRCVRFFFTLSSV